MPKRIGVPLIACLSALLSLGFGYKVFAQATYSGNMLKSVDVLGISLVRSASMKMYVVDVTNQSSSQDITLPTLTGNGGQVYMIRTFDANNEYHNIAIHPANGEKLNGNINDVWYVGDNGSNEYVTVVADETNSTWWVMNSGTF